MSSLKNLHEFLVYSLLENNLLISEQQQQQLCCYVELLMEWNKVHKLTATNNYRDIINDHIIDSLRIKPYLMNAKISLDFGTGAGFPGLILSIVDPSIKWILVDQRSKAMIFLQYVLTSLKLTNIELVEKRAEEFTGILVDIITARAVSQTDSIINSTKHLLAEQGKWLLMKGKRDKALEETLPIGYYRTVVGLNTLTKERSLVIISRDLR